MRLHFTDVTDGYYALYYATSPGTFSQEQCLTAVPKGDEYESCVSFTLDGSLEDSITDFRLDFPPGTDLICVTNITVSSAGIIQKQFTPCDFFAPENLIAQNNITAISLATAQDRAYIATEGDDPFVILSGEICKEINSAFSHLTLTRIGICIFMLGCWWFYKKNLFTPETTKVN